mmetsp:Transcript_93719/g.166746  ORF Transcript_93719/g.166746 Transcript_93719/m.166746 type:complete len:177 (-) Transcript_93719:63-593(-)
MATSYSGSVVLLRSTADAQMKVNWQDIWRSDVKSCSSDNSDLFRTSQGKPTTRKLSEMSQLLAEKIIAKERIQQAEVKPKARPKGKSQSKKERMKQELSEQGVFDGMMRSAHEDARFQDEETYQKTVSTGESFVAQMLARSKLKPETEVTLREWCDLVWRSGRASPLDQDTLATDL